MGRCSTTPCSRGGGSGGTANAHNDADLPATLVGGHPLGVTYRGHIRQKAVRPGNRWQTLFGLMRVTVPRNFQGGGADGAIKAVV